MDPALTAMLVHTISHAAWLSQDGYGAPTFGTPVLRPARVEPQVRRITNAQGQERVSRALVFLDGEVVLDLRDRLTLPDGTVPPIQRIDTLTDADTATVDHLEVWV
jgi:hypothetical protein